MKNIIYKDYLTEKLKDPKYATAYLDACMNESIEADDVGIFVLALTDVIEASFSK